jgi:DNA-binding transcriptional LysR family regulator
MRRIDLNLLYVFRELMKEPNTTKVGDRLGLTQSAVSAALGRLRTAFQDDLFVRSGRGMSPTRRAEALLEPVESVILQLESLVEDVPFEPESLQRHFTLATTDLFRQRVAGPIIQQMSPVAPSARVIFSPLAIDTRDRLRSGHLDLMIAPLIDTFCAMEQIRSQVLFTDHLVAVAWAGSTKFADKLTEQQLIEAPHLEYNPMITNGWNSLGQKFIDEVGIRPRVVAEFATQAAMLYALRNTDVIALAPKRAVEALAQDADIKALELPFNTPEIEFGLLWNRTFDNDPEHLWFRGVVEKAVEEI